MPVSAPLDKVPAIPAKLVNIIITQVNKLISDLATQILDAAEKAIQLPDRCDCNDPKVQAALKSMQDAQAIIARIQQLLPLIQTIITTINTVVTTAKALKAAQLLNPVTGPAVIAAELVIVQNMTIANATIAAEQLKNIPQYLDAALGPLQSKLGDIATKLSPICGAIPVDENTANEMNANGLLNNGLLNLADEMVKQQQDFLTSIEEAPSKVYSGVGEPDPELGKQGDYYINLSNDEIFGPKLTRTSWTDSALNYDVENFSFDVNIADPVATDSAPPAVPDTSTEIIIDVEPFGEEGSSLGETRFLLNYQGTAAPPGSRYRFEWNTTETNAFWQFIGLESI
jgi:hypothetical protein